MDGSSKVQTNCVRFSSHDCIDESVKVFSSIASSLRLPRETAEDFTWPKDAIVVIKNLSEQDCAVSLEILRTDSDALVLRSSRAGAKTFSQGDKSTHVLHAGEAWTLQSGDAVTPAGRLSV